MKAETEILQLLEKAGIESCEPEVIHKLKIFIKKYVKEIVDKANTVWIHSDKTRQDLKPDDIKLAIEIHNENILNKPMPLDLIKAIAKSVNEKPLPEIRKNATLSDRLPEQRLTEPNF